MKSYYVDIVESIINNVDDQGGVYFNYEQVNFLVKYLVSTGESLESLRKMVEMPLCQLSKSNSDDFKIVSLRKAEGE